MEEVMSRDHYKGIPKKRVALLNSDVDLEVLERGGEAKRISGTTSFSGTVTISDDRFVAGAFAVVSGKHPYPADESFNWNVGAGFLTISGSAANNFTIAYEVILP
jgi:folate-binding Fe-S cluster repair protein YgfZ